MDPPSPARCLSAFKCRVLRPHTQAGLVRHQAMIGYASPEEAEALRAIGGLRLNNPQLGALVDAHNWIREDESYGPHATRPCLLGLVKNVEDEDAWQQIDDQVFGR